MNKREKIQIKIQIRIQIIKLRIKLIKIDLSNFSSKDKYYYNSKDILKGLKLALKIQKFELRERR